jgi:integrator complex subunit 6
LNFLLSLCFIDENIDFKLYFSDFAPLFAHLQNIKGGLDVRVTFLKEIIHESLRFKRRYLAGLLEEFLRTMISSMNNSYSAVNNHRPQSNNGATRLA